MVQAVWRREPPLQGNERPAGILNLFEAPPAAVHRGRRDLQGADLAVERAGVDPQLGGGLLPVAGVAAQGFGDHESLHGLKGHEAGGAGGPQFRRQVPDVDTSLLAEHESVLQDVFQLPHVARVIVFHQAHEHRVGNAGHILALEPVQSGDEMVHQQRDVLAALPKGR